MARRVLAYALFAMALITITFARNYGWEYVPSPALSWIGAMIFVWGGWRLQRWVPTGPDPEVEEAEHEFVRRMKKYGDRIMVDLSRCEVKSNDYTEAEEEYHNEAPPPDKQMQVQIWEDLATLPRTVEVHQSVILYSCSYKGLTRTFRSKVLHTDRETILFKLAVQKVTTIYVDKRNNSRYFFDIEFLQPREQAATA